VVSLQVYLQTYQTQSEMHPAWFIRVEAYWRLIAFLRILLPIFTHTIDCCQKQMQGRSCHFF
jgi:hypothetical protein